MNIKEILDNFSKAKIAVVGDVMLDFYTYCKSNRLSPEAPVPVAKFENQVYELGGAANVAANISSLGGNVFLFGYTGKDKARELLIEKLEEHKINYNLYPILMETTQKNRIIANHRQQLLRIDTENYRKVSKTVDKEIFQEIISINPDMIIASDYAKGCLTKNIFSLFKNYNLLDRVIVDPKPENKKNYKGVYLITPNEDEAKDMSGLKKIGAIGKMLQKRFSSNILITRGKEGMTLFDKDRNSIEDIFSQAKEVYDVSGAGDTVVALMGLCLASGLSLEDAASLANHAAGIVVSKAGTASVSKTELEQVIEKEHRKLRGLNELKGIREDYKRKEKEVIWTNGCFDILHAGHVDYLKKARNLGNCLFVGLNSDNSIKRLKGDNRPINKEEHRAEVLSSLECVDYITIFNELTVENCLRELKPDVYAKANDYDLHTMNQSERKLIESYGGEIKFIPIINEVSTTEIIERIRNGSK